MASGAHDLFEISLGAVRIVPILCSLGLLPLIFWLARRYFDAFVAILSALLYATLPFAVVTARLAKDENLLALLLVGALCALVRYFDTARHRWFWLSALAGGLAAFTKPTGLAVPAALFMLLAHRGKFRDAATALVTGALFFGLYFLYGYWQAWDVFLGLFAAHSSMLESFDVVIRIVTEGSLLTIAFGSGWMIWLGISALRLEGEVREVLLIPLLLYLILISLSVDAYGVYSWYRIPLYPLLCVAGAAELQRIWRRQDPLSAVFFVLLALGSALQIVVPEEIRLLNGFIRWSVILLIAPLLLGWLAGRERNAVAYKLYGGLLVALFIALNISIALHMSDLYPLP